MATTRIMPLHIGKGRTESQAVSDIIDYVSKEPLKKAHIKRHEGKGRRNRPEFSQFLRPNAGFCPVF